jgi:hypothetical protein
MIDRHWAEAQPGLEVHMPSGVVRETRFFAAEVKFVVEPPAVAAIRDWARRHLAADPHGSGPQGDEYRVTSIYCDTDDRRVFHQIASFGRAKYRIRRYGDADVAFLERKLRRPRMLAKRRSVIDIASLPMLTGTDVPEAWHGAWFRRRLIVRAMRPVCQISYRRMARVSPDGSMFARLTLDEGVAAVPVIEPAFIAHTAIPVIGDRAVLELKYRHHLPAIFKRLIAEFALEPTRSSKYRLGMAALGLASPPAVAAGGDRAQGSVRIAG